MKDRVIETVGKTWKALGEQGEISVPKLAKTIKEREDIVNQAIGWLAREDKINYNVKRNRISVSLVESEIEAFKNLYQQATRR